MLLRTLTALSLVLVVGGCTQDQRPRASAAKTNCFLQQSYSGRDYAWIKMEVYKVRRESRSAFSRLARPPDSEARAKAVELNRKLDALDQRADEGKAAAGECFGGKAAEGYARTKQLIADQRKDTAEGLENTLARNETLEAERVAFERWRAENQNLLVRDLGDVRLAVRNVCTSLLLNVLSLRDLI